MKHGQKILYLYTDGSCIGNPGVGGWAWCLTDGIDILDQKSGGKQETTCNEMELQAVYEALTHVAHTKGYIMVLDSKYTIDCLSMWYKKWQINGWMTSSKEQVKNADLIQKIVSLYSRINIIKWQWVKGHSGDRFNNHVDKLATSESARLKHKKRKPSNKPSQINPYAAAEQAFLDSVHRAADRFILDVKGCNP